MLLLHIGEGNGARGASPITAVGEREISIDHACRANTDYSGRLYERQCCTSVHLTQPGDNGTLSHNLYNAAGTI